MIHYICRRSLPPCLPNIDPKSPAKTVGLAIRRQFRTFRILVDVRGSPSILDVTDGIDGQSDIVLNGGHRMIFRCMLGNLGYGADLFQRMIVSEAAGKI